MYTIEQLSLITGLTTRTLRSYLKSGILQGGKETGIWQFTEQQASDFLLHPSVRPSIQAKQNAIVYDFLAGQDQTENESCILLNRTAEEAEARAMADFFCRETSKLSHIRFAFSYASGKARYILKGAEGDIRSIMTRFDQQFARGEAE